VKNTSVIRDPW